MPGRFVSGWLMILVLIIVILIIAIFAGAIRSKRPPPPALFAQPQGESRQTTGANDPLSGVDKMMNYLEQIRQEHSPQLQRLRELGRFLDEIYPSGITTLQQQQIEASASQALLGKQISWQLLVGDVRERAKWFFLESRDKGGYWVEHLEHSPLLVVECQSFRTDVPHLYPKQPVIASGRIANMKIQWPSILLMVLLDAVISPTSDTPHAAVEHAELPDAQAIPHRQAAYTASSGEPSYQTAPLTEYSTTLRQRAEELFDAITEQIGPKARKYKGSFSVLANSSDSTAAKIVIYQQGLGRENGAWPTLTDGIYILVRCNGTAGRAIWDREMLRSSAYRQRLNRRPTLGIAPKHNERFAYFRLGPDDDIQKIADLLATFASA